MGPWSPWPRPPQGLAAVQGRPRPANHLDPFELLHVNEESARVTGLKIEADTVQQREDPVTRHPSNIRSLSHGSRAAARINARFVAQDVVQALRLALLKIFLRQDADFAWSRQRIPLGFCSRDRHFFEP